MTHKPSKTGVLLINLGTPDSPKVSDVRKYLDEFLSDPRVIDIHPIRRWLLLNLIILPFRPKKSAEAYRSIWQDGSPLLRYTKNLKEGVAAELGSEFVVEMAMRYQSPSIAEGLKRLALQDAEPIVVFPLFPQYSSAATGSALEKVWLEVARLWNVPSLRIVPPFFDHPDFISSFGSVAEPLLKDFKSDYLLFSYHGLPERHVIKSDASKKHCLKSDSCCDKMGPENRFCYRAHCFATTRALVSTLQLKEGEYGVSFQSRLGRSPWIRPFTDEVLNDLAQQGVRRLAVMCPAFVADCLETIEEIGMRARKQWKELGGEDLLLIPCPNDHPNWIRAVASITKEQVVSQ